jgi:hypothetical protein
MIMNYQQMKNKTKDILSFIYFLLIISMFAFCAVKKTTKCPPLQQQTKLKTYGTIN